LLTLFRASREFVLTALKQIPELEADHLAGAAAIGVQFSVMVQVEPTYIASLIMQTPGGEPRVMLRWVARIDPSEVH
jgi:hypothetical protein